MPVPADPEQEKAGSLRKTDYFGSFLGALTSNETLSSRAADAGRWVADTLGASNTGASTIGASTTSTDRQPDPLNVIVLALDRLNGEGAVKDLVGPRLSISSVLAGIDRLQHYGLATFDGTMVTLTPSGKDVARTLQ